MRRGRATVRACEATAGRTDTRSTMRPDLPARLALQCRTLADCFAFDRTFGDLVHGWYPLREQPRVG